MAEIMVRIDFEPWKEFGYRMTICQSFGGLSTWKYPVVGPGLLVGLMGSVTFWPPRPTSVAVTARLLLDCVRTATRTIGAVVGRRGRTK
jgi:hypothetical protein